MSAKRKAKVLAAKLGPDWVPVVFENMGWHYNVVSKCGRFKVHPSVRGYQAFLGESGTPGGRWVEHGKTAALAVSNVITAAKRSLKEVGAYLTYLPRVKR